MLERDGDAHIDGTSDVNGGHARPRIVIVVASKHGSTLGIAGALAQGFVARGACVTVSEPNDQIDLSAADAVVVGSGVYIGKWMRKARRFIERHRTELEARSVWLFSSGPVGDDRDTGLAVDHIDGLIRRSGAVEHREFAGRLDYHDLGPIETLVARMVDAPSGDYRDWDEVSRWADQIFDRLVPVAANVADAGPNGRRSDLPLKSCHASTSATARAITVSTSSAVERPDADGHGICRDAT